MLSGTKIQPVLIGLVYDHNIIMSKKEVSSVKSEAATVRRTGLRVVNNIYNNNMCMWASSMYVIDLRKENYILLPSGSSDDVPKACTGSRYIAAICRNHLACLRLLPGAGAGWWVMDKQLPVPS
jgi:hypothetical protein